MQRSRLLTRVLLGFAGISLAPLAASGDLVRTCPDGFNDTPVIGVHIEQEDIDSGALRFGEIVEHGEALFAAAFNRCDGSGRPKTTGGGDKRAIPTFSEEGEPLSDGQIEKLRTSAPDSDSCAGCHAQPEPGGAGDFVANVFVLAQTLDPVTLSVSPDRSNSRNTLGMHGAGPIEMLAREMTEDLLAQRAGLPDGVHTLTTKGVDFTIEIVGGEVVEAEGVDHDLIIRPFHQAGKVVSLREFSDNAYNHHHGMQAEERFDLNPAKGEPDFDEDGVERELTIGDITAVSIYQAQLSTPQQVKPKKKADRDLAELGELVFDEVGCTSCHIPKLVLDSHEFVEPNPFNPPGTCGGASEGCPDYAFDMTKRGDKPRLEKGPKGTAIVRAYTDLKRHSLCDDPGDPDPIRFFCNEVLSQGRPDQNGVPGTEFFLTRKLWDVGNTAPYGHRGDVSTIFEAILLHGGEGRASRDLYASLPDAEQQAVVAFLKTLQIVPQSASAKRGSRGNGM
ncbi:MAG: thiol oxidoreductase [Myxococcales bacterium]|nr:thiol oxidoreductase [Myxococcales bacterium]